jgi:hypothetical protein
LASELEKRAAAEDKCRLLEQEKQLVEEKNRSLAKVSERLALDEALKPLTLAYAAATDPEGDQRQSSRHGEKAH